LVALETVALHGGAPDGSSKDKDGPNKSGFASPEIAVLDRFIGPWNVIENHFNARGEVVATVKGTEEIVWVLDKHAIRRTYATGGEPSVFRAIGMLTWNPTRRHYEGAWFDNTSAAGPTQVSGAWDDASLTMTLTLTSSTSDTDKQEFKVVERFTDDEHRISTTYKLRGSEIEKVLEVQYVRTIPCPAATSGVRMIDPETIHPKKD
ncbi:MAG: DUF1579 family protein, partial [Phycisphaerales bacterium]|nr:DUF1579 family protein [Phycisphaerales bacterium]